MCVWFMVCWLCAPDHDSTRPVTRRVLARAVRVAPVPTGPMMRHARIGWLRVASCVASVACVRYGIGYIVTT